MDSYSIEGKQMSKANRKQLLKNCVEQLKTCYSIESFKYYELTFEAFKSV